MADEIGVRNQDARRFIMRSENANRLAGLHQQRFIVFQLPERTHDRIERLPTPRSPTRAAINNQLSGILRDLGIEIVHQHPHRGFLMPAFAAQLISARRAYHAISSS